MCIYIYPSLALPYISLSESLSLSIYLSPYRNWLMIPIPNGLAIHLTMAHFPGSWLCLHCSSCMWLFSRCCVQARLANSFWTRPISFSSPSQEASGSDKTRVLSRCLKGTQGSLVGSGRFFETCSYMFILSCWMIYCYVRMWLLQCDGNQSPCRIALWHSISRHFYASDSSRKLCNFEVTLKALQWSWSQCCTCYRWVILESFWGPTC
jgi:hypothetical protein